MTTKPNILIIMTDQLRYDAISCSGNISIKTPNIDQIADNGIYCSKAYAEFPECMPARHALISGKHPFRTGVYSNGNGRLDPKTPTFPGLLSDVGYRTHGIGKFHHVPHTEPFGYQTRQIMEEGPKDIATDAYLSYLSEKGFLHLTDAPHGFRSALYYQPQPSVLPVEHHGTTWVGNQTVEFIKNQKESKAPFLLTVSFIKPHPPFDPPYPYFYKYLPEEMKEAIKYPGQELDHTFIQHKQNRYKSANTDPYFIKTMRAFYHALVSQIDDQVGRILEQLRLSGCLENTMILFFSDHGEALGDHGCYGKRSWLEGAGRIPFLISHPAALPKKTTYDGLLGHLDVMPTLLSLAGVPQPEKLDGKDLLSHLSVNRPVRKELFGLLDFGATGSIHAVISDKTKYIHSTTEGKEQIYSLDEDPMEVHNLAQTSAGSDIKSTHQKSLRDYYQTFNQVNTYFEADGTWKQAPSDEGKLWLEKYHNNPPTDWGRLHQYPDWNKRKEEMNEKISKANPKKNEL